MEQHLPPVDLRQFEQQAGDAAGLLRILGNQRRLMVLCKLTEFGRARVTDLAVAVGVSQSALSQHLAKMRDEGLVAFDREGQTLWYRISDPRVGAVLATLYDLFCNTSED